MLPSTQLVIKRHVIRSRRSRLQCYRQLYSYRMISNTDLRWLCGMAGQVQLPFPVWDRDDVDWQRTCTQRRSTSRSVSVLNLASSTRKATAAAAAATGLLFGANTAFRDSVGRAKADTDYTVMRGRIRYAALKTAKKAGRSRSEILCSTSLRLDAKKKHRSLLVCNWAL